MSKVSKILDKQLQSDSELAPLADELGKIKAEQAKLKKRADAITSAFKDAGVHELEGDLFRVVCSPIPDALGVDWEKIAIKLGATDRMIEHPANQRVTKSAHTRVSVYARTGETA